MNATRDGRFVRPVAEEIEAISVIGLLSLHGEFAAVIDRCLEGDIQPQRILFQKFAGIGQALETAGDDPLCGGGNRA